MKDKKRRYSSLRKGEMIRDIIAAYLWEREYGML